MLASRHVWWRDAHNRGEQGESGVEGGLPRLRRVGCQIIWRGTGERRPVLPTGRPAAGTKCCLGVLFVGGVRIVGEGPRRAAGCLGRTLGRVDE
jgi:hypothetical protein